MLKGTIKPAICCPGRTPGSARGSAARPRPGARHRRPRRRQGRRALGNHPCSFPGRHARPVPRGRRGRPPRGAAPRSREVYLRFSGPPVKPRARPLRPQTRGERVGWPLLGPTHPGSLSGPHSPRPAAFPEPPTPRRRRGRRHPAARPAPRYLQ